MYTIARLHKTRDQSKIYTELSVGQLGKERLMIEVIKSISSFFYAFPKIADIKRGIVLLSVPRVEALALPIIVDEIHFYTVLKRKGGSTVGVTYKIHSTRTETPCL